jgi:hypothetical protein
MLTSLLNREQALSHKNWHDICVPLHIFEDNDYELAASSGAQGRAPAYWYLVDLKVL